MPLGKRWSGLDAMVSPRCAAEKAHPISHRNLHIANFMFVVLPCLQEVFACDYDAKVRAVLLHNFPNLKGKIFWDAMLLNMDLLRQLSPPSELDLFTAGFPCQPFSAAGLNQGVEDTAGRGSPSNKPTISISHSNIPHFPMVAPATLSGVLVIGTTLCVNGLWGHVWPLDWL